MRLSLTAAAAMLAAVLSAPSAEAEMMDDAIFSSVLVDKLEYRAGDDGAALAWDLTAWAGGDEWKLALESEGEYARRPDSFEKLENQVYVRRMVTEFFDAKAGLRLDTPAGPDRAYAVLGLLGLAQQWLEVEGELFLSERGDLSARLTAEYDLLLTNRLILQPQVEVEAAASDDREIGRGQGFGSVELGLRLRYELVDRSVAPYLGVHWERTLGESAGIARSEGEDTASLRAVAGLRLLF